MVSVEENENSFVDKLINNEDFYDKRYYKLAYLSNESDRDLDKMDIICLNNYLNRFYLKADKINKKNLVSDLVTFKTYRDELELHLRYIDLFLNVVAIIVASSSLLITSKSFWRESLFPLLGENNFIPNILMFLAWTAAVAGLAIFVIWNKKDETPYKLKNIDNAIYILEAIKEEL